MRRLVAEANTRDSATPEFLNETDSGDLLNR